MKIISLEEIQKVLPDVDLISEIEAGFVAYSRGESVVPPVGELVMKDPPGDVHIKYGYLKGDDYYVIKIASGFYENARLDLPTSNGMMLMFSQETGEPVAIMLDECYLTDVRTAVAGAVAARYLAPEFVERIGIAGTGVQARLQLEHLKPITDCRDVLVWGRDDEKIADYRADMEKQGFTVKGTREAHDLLDTCNLIVTTTASTDAILQDAGKVRDGLHITAMGSDTQEKRELSSAVMQEADLVVADSIPQCLKRGEIYKALSDDAIEQENIVEIGAIIGGQASGRTSEEQVTIADLTGVAVQDIAISKAVYKSLK